MKTALARLGVSILSSLYLGLANKLAWAWIVAPRTGWREISLWEAMAGYVVLGTILMRNDFRKDDRTDDEKLGGDIAMLLVKPSCVIAFAAIFKAIF